MERTDTERLEFLIAHRLRVVEVPPYHYAVANGAGRRVHEFKMEDPRNAIDEAMRAQEIRVGHPHFAVKTPEQWCDIKGITILDPDGWRGPHDPDIREPITEADFDRRVVRSTCCLTRKRVAGTPLIPLIPPIPPTCTCADNPDFCKVHAA